MKKLLCKLFGHRELFFYNNNELSTDWYCKRCKKITGRFYWYRNVNGGNRI